MELSKCYMTGIITLEAVLTLLNGEDSPVRTLVLYYLVPVRRERLLPGCANICSSVLIPSVFYESVLVIFR